MKKSFKFRLYLKKNQEDHFDNTFNLCRKIYNAGLEERIRAYKERGLSISYSQQANQLPQLKKHLLEYQRIHSQVLQDVLRRLDKAYKNFFRRAKAGEKPGFPRFKGRNRFKSITYPQGGFKILQNGHLRLSKVGMIRMFKHRDIEGDIKTLTIKREGDKWFAVFSCEAPNVKPVTPKTAIGVDVGLEKIVTLSTGEAIKPPKLLRRSEERIKILQRRVSRKKKGSVNRRKSVQRLARAHARIRRQRSDFNHKLALFLVNKADIIVFEKLAIKNMVRNHYLAKSIQDAAWGQLIQFTAYKAVEAGKLSECVNPRGTSQTCSNCGAKYQISLNERFFKCPTCKSRSDRDWNASLNILRRLGAGSVELLQKNACGGEAATPINLVGASPVDEAGGLA